MTNNTSIKCELCKCRVELPDEGDENMFKHHNWFFCSHAHKKIFLEFTSPPVSRYKALKVKRLNHE